MGMNSSSDRKQLGNGQTILVAENELGVRAFLRYVLQERGYKVLEAKNGDEAVRQAQQHAEKIHLLICEVVLPDLTGPSLAEKIVALHPGVKVLFISGNPDEDVIKHGVVGCLQKPFSLRTLQERVRQILDQ